MDHIAFPCSALWRHQPASILCRGLTPPQRQRMPKSRPIQNGSLEIRSRFLSSRYLHNILEKARTPLCWCAKPPVLPTEAVPQPLFGGRASSPRTSIQLPLSYSSLAPRSVVDPPLRSVISWLSCDTSSDPFEGPGRRSARRWTAPDLSCERVLRSLWPRLAVRIPYPIYLQRSWGCQHLRS